MHSAVLKRGDGVAHTTNHNVHTNHTASLALLPLRRWPFDFPDDDDDELVVFLSAGSYDANGLGARRMCASVLKMYCTTFVRQCRRG